jgi:hypothetical protein
MPMTFQKLTFNFKPAAVRHATMNGKEYVVAPIAAMTEGVHEGSDGPLFYSADELSKTPVVWNHKPLVVYHPEENGVAVSACSPDVVEKQGVGMLFNSHFDSKLRMEGWFEKSKIYGPGAVDPRIGNAIDKNQMMEVSTGVFVDNDGIPGEWNGEKYIGTARNHRPDHLAILPDKAGACSIADGAGLLQTNAEGGDLAKELYERVRLLVRDKFGESAWPVDVWKNGAVYSSGEDLYEIGIGYKDDGEIFLIGSNNKVQKQTAYIRADGTKVVPADDAPLKNEGKNMPNVLKTNTKEPKKPDKKSLVDNLIKNEEFAWEESDRKFLETLDEPKLIKMASKMKKDKKEESKDDMETEDCVDNGTSDGSFSGESTGSGPSDGRSDGTQMDRGYSNTTDGGGSEEEDNDMHDAQSKKNQGKESTKGKKGKPDPYGENKMVGSQATKKLSLNEYLEQSPPEVREMVQEGLAARNTNRERLVDTITSNERNVFSKEYLEGRSMDELRGLAHLASVDLDNQTNNGSIFRPDYSGAAGGNPGLVANQDVPVVYDPDMSSMFGGKE